jgi:hypothetical protein
MLSTVEPRSRGTSTCNKFQENRPRTTQEPSLGGKCPSSSTNCYVDNQPDGESSQRIRIPIDAKGRLLYDAGRARCRLHRPDDASRQVVNSHQAAAIAIC